ncbi:allantoate amidohydrolase [Acinetobacter nectaris]|uniref:allantoate amidohydrolase n=1 Tax=Acinetobacter nectaris TaxID=1219382 RepID=UPI001F019869|nr:allantoate amidohydrolase [Acinetobacter nectaris]MCF8998589.1 allantoate amidohydrolase [Acinetobacter nectaris]MCF9027703.1 allantoate amidohydrolase [Acinetobacter nectaris]
MIEISSEYTAFSAQRVMARIESLAKISSDTDAMTRVYLSKEHQQANVQVATWMQEIGMHVWQDAVGNICGRYEGTEPNAPAILLGSHLDTVRNAGKYDGILGVLTALEVVAFLHEHQYRLPVAVEIVGFADEEGTRFDVTLLGSKALTGQWEKDWFERKDRDGVSIAQAMQDFGLNPLQISEAQRKKEDIAAYLELHIEQGPCLEAENLALGVVTAINGARRLICQFKGHAGHAGTVPMQHRKDALVAAAKWIVEIDEYVPQADSSLVATVGYIENKPNAVNVISGQVSLSLDIRGPNDAAIDQALEKVLEKAQHIATTRGLTFESDEFYRIQAIACDENLQQRFAHGISKVQTTEKYLPSGAGHDAIAIATQWPVGMLFVRCEKGVSHHPAEAITTHDAQLAIHAYIETVLTWAQT